jgi:hypothetical protein
MEDVKPPTTAKPRPSPTPCLCAVLRQASRAVTRIYDAELCKAGLRSLAARGLAGRHEGGIRGTTISLSEVSVEYVSPTVRLKNGS